MHVSAVFAALALSAAAVSTPLRAQVVDTTAATPSRDTLVRDTTHALKTVIVTGTDHPSSRYGNGQSFSATKTPALLRNIPQSVTVLTHTLLKDQGSQGMADIVRYVPGVTMGQGEGNRDQPTIRGNSTTADFFIDGIRDDAQYFRDLYNVERIEAITGSNAMIFGRGGGGGVLNRVMKEATWIGRRELTVQGGSYDNKRSTVDIGGGMGAAVAGRINGIYERSGLFRDRVAIHRSGLNPTLSIMSPSENTRVALGYESFRDHRTADRGIPSYAARPLQSDISTFFGDPGLSYSDVIVNSGVATLSHSFNTGVSVRSSTRYTSYDKFYQNVFPGAVTASGDEVTISAYNNSHDRRNLFNQTELTVVGSAGEMHHTFLVGAELGRQVTDNFRRTGFFNDTAVALTASVARPTVSVPVRFAQSATDADNHVTNSSGSVYAQEQLEISRHFQLLAGVRYERFGIRFHNNRTSSALRRDDSMVSPRVGVLLKPIASASIYGSVSVSYLPSAGDQFSSLTDVTRGLEPERFSNREIGLKWDVANRLALTAAFYQLDRTNTRAPSPDNPGVIVQTGSQRSKGFEAGASGSITPHWDLVAAYAQQRAVIRSTTSAAPAGTIVPLVPRTSLSVWNRYQAASRLGLGIGVIHQSAMYAAVSNTVKLPAFTRADGAAYFAIVENLSAQLNVENLFDATYYPLANGNNNITPGSPRAVRLSLTSTF